MTRTSCNDGSQVRLFKYIYPCIVSLPPSRSSGSVIGSTQGEEEGGSLSGPRTGSGRDRRPEGLRTVVNVEVGVTGSVVDSGPTPAAWGLLLSLVDSVLGSGVTHVSGASPYVPNLPEKRWVSHFPWTEKRSV